MSKEAMGLTHNATAGEVMEALDALALQIYPRAYWGLTWTTSCLNLVSLMGVVLAMLLYGHRRTPLWFVKLETRTYTVRVHTSTNTPIWHRISRLFQTPPGKHETRVGKFITASCINCHLVFSEVYVLSLFIKTVVSYTSRGAGDAAPVLSPEVWHIFMIAFIFSTAYFSTLGYVAVLAPNTTPAVWNGCVAGVYASIFVYALACFVGSARSAVQIDALRRAVYEHLCLGASLRGWNGPGKFDAAARADVESLALVARTFAEAEQRRRWLLKIYSLIAAGGVMLAIVYLVILGLLTRKIAAELVLIRQTPSDKSAKHTSATVSAEEGGEAVVISKLLAQPGGLSQLNRARVRTPPPKPAPNAPLPPTPQPSLRCTTPDSTYSMGESAHRHHDSVGSNLAESSPVPLVEKRAHRNTPASPPTRSADGVHDALATDEGYLAVCRFLFSCVIDHVVVALLCLEFGASSMRLCMVFARYPREAHAASLAAGHVDMFGSCWFTLLKTVNSMNLFAPFVLFPASHMKLASILEGAGAHHRRTRRSEVPVQSQVEPSAPPSANSEAGGVAGYVAMAMGMFRPTRPASDEAPSTSVATEQSSPSDVDPTPSSAGSRFAAWRGTGVERDSISVSSHTTMPARRDLVLNALISSRALPIQGFYCHPTPPPYDVHLESNPFRAERQRSYDSLASCTSPLSADSTQTLEAVIRTGVPVIIAQPPTPVTTHHRPRTTSSVRHKRQWTLQTNEDVEMTTSFDSDTFGQSRSNFH